MSFSLQILSVSLGSALGGVSRFLLSRTLNPLWVNFPLGTFFANIAGCLLLGFFNGLFSKGNFLTPEIRLAFTVGFCGSFTTFSTFLSESISIFSRGRFDTFFYMAISLILGIIALLFGMWLASKVR